MKAYTDLEQSKKLAEILPIESADHHYVRKTCDFMSNPVDGKWSEPKYGNPNSKYANYMVQNFTSYETIPCWSLAALVDCIKDKCNYFELVYLNSTFDGRANKLENVYRFSTDVYDVYQKESVDACYEMILKLHEEKIL